MVAYYGYHLPKSILQQVPITITAQELWARDISPIDLPLYSNIPTDNLPEILRYLLFEV